ncbi:hypothetical protein [Mucilaginibacter arboris]|uniref:Uncharacterized protein n=1 Tax=Mucilaginibacter arboris TaxID=2682090 RepID=A0A7K1SYN7_9SPHI|nr:hypothetical protein [Mucilaginibacter arboris]MVN22421.1 hypothetical protein [Mucilaginibacter arboris]
MDANKGKTFIRMMPNNKRANRKGVKYILNNTYCPGVILTTKVIYKYGKRKKVSSEKKELLTVKQVNFET